MYVKVNYHVKGGEYVVLKFKKDFDGKDSLT